MERSAIAAFVLSLILATRGFAQSTYDVSTVKPAKSGEVGSMIDWREASLSAKNVTLEWILTSAFHARNDQIVDLPGWARDAHFDINAKLTEMDTAAAEKLTEEQHRTLLLNLLTERFGLKYHVDTRQMPIYDLEPAKEGARITAAADPEDKQKEVYGMCSGCSSWGNSVISAHGIPMSYFTELLAAAVRRDVHDHTGFQGKIDVRLKWERELGSAPAPEEEDAALPPLPEALQKEMGLRLVPGKGPVKVYVVEHLDKPSEN